jgi:hypothetical protein
MSADEVRTEATTVLDAGVAFWRDFFVPDLFEVLERAAVTAQ